MFNSNLLKRKHLPADLLHCDLQYTLLVFFHIKREKKYLLIIKTKRKWLKINFKNDINLPIKITFYNKKIFKRIGNPPPQKKIIHIHKIRIRKMLLLVESQVLFIITLTILLNKIRFFLKWFTLYFKTISSINAWWCVPFLFFTCKEISFFLLYVIS